MVIGPRVLKRTNSGHSRTTIGERKLGPAFIPGTGKLDVPRRTLSRPTRMTGSNPVMSTRSNMETKQVIVMRKDLNMRKGKMIAQGAHASLGVFTQTMSYGTSNMHKEVGVFNNVYGPMLEWCKSSFKKVCVYVTSEEALMEVYESIPSEIPKILITDSGATEFNGVPTKTCIAVGPWWSDEIDKYTGKLPLL